MLQYIVLTVALGTGTYIFFGEYAVQLSGIFTPLIDALSRIPV